MEILFGLTLVAVLAFIAVILPILGWARAARAMSEVTELRARLSALEQRVRDVASDKRPAPAQAQTPPREAPSAATPGAAAPPAPEISAPTAVPIPPEPPPVPVVVPEPVLPESVPVPNLPPVAPPEAPAVTPISAAVAEVEEGWLEAAIGGRLLLYVGTLALVLGVGFF